MRVRIAARQSDLARLQAYRVGDALKSHGHEVVYAFRASLGDVNLNDPLWKMPEKGVFTEDFVRDLREGTADLVVHSWKDLPTHQRVDTEIVATMPRADTRDLFLFRRDRAETVRESGKLRVLTSSPRRSHNLREFLSSHLPFRISEVGFEPVRGNIQTRLKKLLAQDVDGLIVAKAALDRLLDAPEPEFVETQATIRDVLSKTCFMVLPLSVNPTAAAQGALAIEIPVGRPDLKEALSKIHCAETFETVGRERAILASHGGGCHQKIGVNVLRRPFGQITFLRGLTDAGVVLDSIEVERKDSPILASAETAIFPKRDEEAAFFDREPLGRETWAWAEGERFTWVARETSWPDGFRPGSNAVVWTAGLTTWRKLAARGVWVSGSSEGLGEMEPARIEALVGLAKGAEQANGTERKIDWVKLTHESSAKKAETTSSTASSASTTGAMRVAAAYRLVPKKSGPDLRGRTHFFWMSGTAFDRALELYPEIRGGHHASGPGHTHKHLQRVLGSEARVSVHLGVEAWRRAVLKQPKAKPD